MTIRRRCRSGVRRPPHAPAAMRRGEELQTVRAPGRRGGFVVFAAAAPSDRGRAERRGTIAAERARGRRAAPGRSVFWPGERRRAPAARRPSHGEIGRVQGHFGGRAWEAPRLRALRPKAVDFIGEPGGLEPTAPRLKVRRAGRAMAQFDPFSNRFRHFRTTLPVPIPLFPHVRPRSPLRPPGEERRTRRVGVIVSATFNSDRARCPGTEREAASHVAPRPRCGARRHATTRRRGSSARFRPGWSEIQSIMALRSPRVRYPGTCVASSSPHAASLIWTISTPRPTTGAAALPPIGGVRASRTARCAARVFAEEVPRLLPLPDNPVPPPERVAVRRQVKGCVPDHSGQPP